MTYIKFDMNTYKVSNLIYDINNKTPICIEMFVSSSVDTNGRSVGIPYLWGAQVYGTMLYGRNVDTLVSFITEIVRSGAEIVYTFIPIDLMYFISPYFELTGNSLKGHSGELFKFGLVVDNHILTVRSLSSISGSNTVEDLAEIPPRLERRCITPMSKLQYDDFASMYKILRSEEAFVTNLSKIYGCVSRIPNSLSTMIKHELAESCFDGKSRPYYQKQLGYFEKDRESYKLMPLPIINETHFNMLDRAYQGGYVGFNTSLRDKTINNVMSFDFTSSYIACMLAYKYPVQRYGMIKKPSYEQACALFNEGYLGIMRVLITGLQSTSICRPIKVGILRDTMNLRKGAKCVVSMSEDSRVDIDSGLVSSSSIYMDITSIDLKYLPWFYTWESISIIDLDLYKSDYLPKGYTDVVLKLYRDKSINKGNPDKFIETVTKKKVNITYGMLTSGFWTSGYEMRDNSFVKVEYDLSKIIDDYNRFKGRFAKRVSAYQWGVFCTAYARYNLFMIIKGLGDSWIYSDTDSVYFMYDEKYLRIIEKYNRYITDLLLKSPSIQSPDDICVKSDFVDKTYHLGHMIQDGDYLSYKFLKLKTYLCEYRTGGYKLTIAGCSNFNHEFFETVDPFEWFTLKGNHRIPAEYCDSYNGYICFGEYHGVVIDYQMRKRSVDLMGGCYKEYNDFSLGVSKLNRIASMLEAIS